MKSKCLVFCMAVLVIFTLQACSGGGGGGGGSTAVGNVQLLATDAPGDFDHVYITVKDVWFHTSDNAGPNDPAWLKYPLSTPATVDLLSLSNGNMQSLWSNIQLPVGTYQQIRLFLEPTNPSAANPAPAGHTYFNEVVTSPTGTAPLYVPDADHGIKLVGTFNIINGGTLRLAVDFDAGHDVVEFHEGSDYILKPSLKYYDLDNAGAIVGQLSTSGSVTAARFVIKAERLATAKEMLASGSTTSYHVVRRWTVPKADGSFILYPISTLITGTWDVVIRGLNTETMIVKGIPVAKGSTPASGATDLSTISTSPTITPNNDYPVAGTITSPSGAWVQFYQTLRGTGTTEYPYEIRFRHFNPLWSGFQRTFMLNDDQIQMANFVSSGAPLSFSPINTVAGTGSYDAVAGAILFDRSAPLLVTSSTTTVAFSTPLTVMLPYQGNSVTGSIVMQDPMMMNNMMDRGRLFAVNGGMIVDAIDVNSQMTGTMNNGYSIGNLPGGSTATPLPGAFYGIDAIGWLSTAPTGTYRAVAIPQVVDLRTGSATATTMTMLPLW